MRIALLTWDMPPAPTGLGRAANEIARGLLAAGVDVTVFAANHPASEVQDGLRIVSVPLSPGSFLARARLRACRGHLAVPIAFRRAVERHGPFDLAETTNWYAPGALVRGMPVVVRCSTPAIDALDPAMSERDRRDLLFAHAMERRTVLGAPVAIYNTEPHRRAMRDAYDLPEDHRSTVIGLSLGDDVIARGSRAPWPPVGAPRYLFVGRAERRKGFDEVLGAFALLHAAEPDSRLDVVGMERRDLDERAAALGVPSEALAAATAHGRADDATLHALLDATHVVLAPSRYESYGLVYREAAAWGRACVMSREDPSANDFVERVGSGVLAARTEPEAIAAAVREARAQAAELRRRGLAHAETLSRQRLGERTAAVYEAVLRTGRRDRASRRPVA